LTTLQLPAQWVKSLDLQQVLLINAVRKPYGLTTSSDIYNDRSESALWTWELVLPQIHLQPSLASKS